MLNLFRKICMPVVVGLAICAIGTMDGSVFANNELLAESIIGKAREGKVITLDQVKLEQSKQEIERILGQTDPLFDPMEGNEIPADEAFIKGETVLNYSFLRPKKVNSIAVRTENRVDGRIINHFSGLRKEQFERILGQEEGGYSSEIPEDVSSYNLGNGIKLSLHFLADGDHRMVAYEITAD